MPFSQISPPSPCPAESFNCIFGCTGSSLLWMCSLYLGRAGAALQLRCVGFCECGYSRCTAQALERRVGSCGAWDLATHSIWDLLDYGLNLSPLHWRVDS